MEVDDFGIPKDSNSKRILMPLTTYRFKLLECPEAVTQQVEEVVFDFKSKTIGISIRASMQGSDFEAVEQFANSEDFALAPMDGSLNIHYKIWCNVELKDHHLMFSYSAPADIVRHKLVFNYTSLRIQDSAQEAVEQGPVVSPLKPDPNFPTIQEAMEKLKAVQ